MNRLVKILLGVSVTLWLTGCRGATLDSTYGAVRRPSVNGVGVFVDMLRAKGRRVDVLPGLSDRLSRYSVIVVLHESFDPLPPKAYEFLQEQFHQGEVVLVALRDCDWSIDYWNEISRQLETSDPEAAAAARRAGNTARIQFLTETADSFSATQDKPFGLDGGKPLGVDRATKVNLLSHAEGDGPTEFDVNFPLRRRLKMDVDPRRSLEPTILWKVGDEPLLTSYQQGHGPYVLVLGTTAPLLNAGMVNPGNRKLTQDLVQQLESTEPIAVVTSSVLVDDDEEISMWRFARIFPHPWIIGQSLFALILFCWWRWPIFGRPHSDQSQATKRFGHHVAAVGELLAATGDVRFAVQRIQEWQRVQEHRKGRRG